MAARRSGTVAAHASVALPQGPERRRTQRIDSHIRGTVRLADDVEEVPTRSRVVDISDHGVRMEVARRLPVGCRVVLDLECELPLRVHLGYDADSLVVDGPMHTHMVRIAGVVVRSERRPGRTWEVGVQVCPETSRFDELQSMSIYVDHLREQETSAF